MPFVVLMEALGVSRAAPKRDLAYLRERLHAPLAQLGRQRDAAAAGGGWLRRRSLRKRRRCHHANGLPSQRSRGCGRRCQGR
ncbi:MAG: hypothetical protein ACK4MK_10580 [Tepidimonas ignava]